MSKVKQRGKDLSWQRNPQNKRGCKGMATTSKSGIAPLQMKFFQRYGASCDFTTRNSCGMLNVNLLYCANVML